MSVTIRGSQVSFRRHHETHFYRVNLPARAGLHSAQTANYRIEFTNINTPKLEVTAVVPIDGKELLMTDTRPGDVPEVGDNGWPALIRELRVTDERGRTLETKPAGPKGWELSEPHMVSG